MPKKVYNTQLAEAIADNIGLGLTDEEAAAICHVPKGTLQYWREKNEEFQEIVREATAKRLRMRIMRVESGEAGWQGTLALLERLHKERFARPEVLQQINVQANGSGDVSLSLTSANLQVYRDQLNRLQATDIPGELCPELPALEQ